MSEGKFKKWLEYGLKATHGLLIDPQPIYNLIEEAKADLATDIYGLATMYDIPKLQKKFEKWFGTEGKK